MLTNSPLNWGHTNQSLFKNQLIFYAMLYDILKTINVNNWYLGEITALYAFHTGATIESYQDRQKVAKTLLKYGFKPVFSGHVIQEIVNLNKERI